VNLGRESAPEQTLEDEERDRRRAGEHDHFARRDAVRGFWGDPRS
jgi:hypothetical protein